MAGLGGISGTVSDASGARIPGAQVTVTNADKGINRVLTTNEAGLFNAGSLTPDSGYAVKVTKDGFEASEVKAIVVQVGQVVNLNVALAVSGAAATISVVDEAPVVDSQKQGVSQVVTSEQIDNLPINGRRVDSFVLLTPGVTNDGTFGNVTFRGVAGGNAFLTDGNDTTNSFYNENAGRTRISANISQDSVQEFQVLTGGNAEFGRASGGVINTVTKSGGNAVHGTAFWFYRDQNFNARDRYAFVNPQERRQQFGGSIGGPIKKDKLFYFFNTELTRRNFPLVSSHTFSPLFNTNGQFIGTCAAPATPAQCSAARTFLDRFTRVIDRQSNQELAFGKIDYRANDKNTVSLSFNYLRWISPAGIQTGATLNNGGGLGNNGLSTVRNRNGRIAWTNLPTTSMVNEFRFGWFKDRQADFLDETLNPPGGVLVSLTVNGVSNLGTPNILPRVTPTEDRFQFADNLSWVVGRHMIKFGADLAQNRMVQDQLLNGRGTYTYPTLTAFAQDFSANADGGKRWQSFTQAFGNPLSTVWVRDYNFFVQDQFRASQRLTLNYGLRYEFSQFTQPTQTVANYPLTGRIPEPGKNFAPRFGVAYALRPESTILRASWGMFYARFPGGLITNLNILNFQQRSINLQSSRPADIAAGPQWPNGLASLGSLASAGATSIVQAGNTFRTPYTLQGDIALEQRMGRKNTLTVSWAYNRGLRNHVIQDINAGPLGAPVSYRILNSAGAVEGTYVTDTYRLANRVNPVWQRVNTIESIGNLWYNAMLVQFRNQQVKRGPFELSGSISHTWAHSIDENLGGGSSNIFFSGGPPTLYNGQSRYERGSSQLDQRHRFVVGELIRFDPMKNKDSAVARYLANGWQLSVLATFASSFAFTPTVTTVGTPFPGAAFNTSLNGLGGDNRVPFLPRNSLDVGVSKRADVRLSKFFRFNERYGASFNFEAFNVTNSPFNTTVRSQVYQAQNGDLRPLADAGTGSASAGFPDGTNVRRMQLSLRLTF